MLRSGDRIPEFELADADGNALSSRTLRGRTAVIYFYPKDFTPGCTTEADEFARDHGRFERAGARVIGVSPDDSDSHSRFCKKMRIPYTLLADTDNALSRAFGVWGKKKFMGREYMGVKRSTFVADERGVIFKVFENVRPKGHAAEVLACIEARGA